MPKTWKLLFRMKWPLNVLFILWLRKHLKYVHLFHIIRPTLKYHSYWKSYNAGQQNLVYVHIFWYIWLTFLSYSSKISRNIIWEHISSILKKDTLYNSINQARSNKRKPCHPIQTTSHFRVIFGTRTTLKLKQQLNHLKSFSKNYWLYYTKSEYHSNDYHLRLKWTLLF